MIFEGPDGFRIFCDECLVGTEVGVTAARGVLLQEIVRNCRGSESLAVFTPGLAALIRDVLFFLRALNPESPLWPPCS
jgi:hypothetical protein